MKPPPSVGPSDDAAVLFDELDLVASVFDDEDPGLFVDVGAHIGRFSHRFAELGWRVVAFEPAPLIAARLRDSLAPFPDCEVVEAAVGDSDQNEVDFFISSEHWGIHSLSAFHESHTEKVTVPLVRLGRYLEGRELAEPQVLKVDAEGADFQALRGWDFDRSLPTLILTEFMDERSQPAFGYGFKDVIAFMRGLGYVAYISEWTPIQEYSREGVRANGSAHIGVFPANIAHSPSWGNLIFVAEERRSWFEQRLIEYLSRVALSSSSLIRTASEKAKLADNATTALQNREIEIDHLHEIIEKRHRRLEELDSVIAQRDARIAELDSVIARRDARIAELDSAIAQRDARIAELDSAIAQRDARIAELDSAIALRDARIRDLASQLSCGDRGSGDQGL